MNNRVRGVISEAIEQASPGDQIRLEPGVYNEAIVADRAVTIYAEVPGETVIVPPGDERGLYITADATIIGLSFHCQGRRNTAIEIAAGAPTLDGLIIEEAGMGILVSGENATATVRQVALLQCRIGIQVNGQAQLSIEDCRVDQSVLYPLWVTGTSSLEAIRTTFSAAKMGAVIVQDNSRADFRGCEWLGSPTAGEKQRRFHAQLMVLETATAALSESCRIAAGSAVGIMVSGGVLTMSDCAVENNGWGGLQITQKGQAEITRCQFSGNQGAGIIARDASTLDAREIKVVNNKAAGIAMIGASFGEFRQSLVLGNLCGAVLQEGARGRFEDCDLRGNAQGAFVVSPDSQQESVRVQTQE